MGQKKPNAKDTQNLTSGKQVGTLVYEAHPQLRLAYTDNSESRWLSLAEPYARGCKLEGSESFL